MMSVCVCVCLCVCVFVCVCVSVCVCVCLCVRAVAILAQAGTLPWSSGESSAAVVSRHPLKRGGSPLQGLSSASRRTPPLLPRPFEGVRLAPRPGPSPRPTTARTSGRGHGATRTVVTATAHRAGPTNQRSSFGNAAPAPTSSRAQSAKDVGRNIGT